MFAKLVPDESTQSRDNSFTLDKKFTNAHQIDLVLQDKHNQHAVFVTQSIKSSYNTTNNQLIDSVTLLKLTLAADDKLIQNQVNIALPEKQVNANVICTLSANKDIIHCYCFY